MDSYRDFHPDAVVQQENRLDSTSGEIVLIILNVFIDNRELFTKLWLKAQMKICADGGSNRLYDLFTECPEFRAAFLPTVIAGDLDSIRPEVREYYEHHSVPIREDVSQDATDLKKCFDWVREVGIPQLQATTDVAVKVSILIFGSLAGRVDQAFSLLHHLVLTENQLLPYMGDGRIYLVGSESITFLLSNRRKNRIFLMGRRPQRTCGILPAGAPAVISTKGLNWDVIDWTTSIGTRVSTSNWIVDESVEVACSEQVFFTVQVCKA